jgi:hypothetical protein
MKRKETAAVSTASAPSETAEVHGGTRHTSNIHLQYTTARLLRPLTDANSRDARQPQRLAVAP